MIHLKGKPGFTNCGVNITHNVRRGLVRVRKEPLETTESFEQVSCITCSKYEEKKQKSAT